MQNLLEYFLNKFIFPKLFYNYEHAALISKEF